MQLPLKNMVVPLYPLYNQILDRVVYEEWHLLHRVLPNIMSSVIQMVLYVMDYHMINALLVQIEEDVVHGNKSNIG